MFQSPLKTVSEKIKPVESKSSVSSLKFERPSDFKKFINFIKNETKELEKIKLPTTAEVEPKSKRGGAIGLLGLGLFGLLASAFGGGEEGDDRFSIGGGTRSQFKPVKIPLVGGVLNEAKRSSNIRLRTEELTKRYEKLRKQRFRKRFKDPELIKKEAEIKKVRSPLEQRIKRRQKRLSTREGNIIQLKSKLKTISETRKIKKQFYQESPIDKFNRVMDQIKNEPNEILKAKLKRQLTDEVALPEEVFEDQRFAKYTDAEMKQIEELFGKTKKQQAKDIELQKKEKKLLREQTKELKKIRSERYAFRGQPNFKIGKFSPKDFLNKKFTQFGTATKPARDVVKKAVSKIPLSKSTGLFLGKNLMRLGKGIDFLTAGYESFKLYQGFRKGDNILTAYYDLGVAIHNMFEPDKTKLMTYITNHQDSRLKVKKQEKNQKIRDEIQKAKEAQALSGGFNPINKASDIVPFAVQKTGQQIMLSSPAFTGYRFILDKLYKQ